MKVGRNALCPCGSGRKFKRCCFNRVARLMPAGQAELWDEEENADENGDPAELARLFAQLVASGGPEALTADIHELLAENLNLLIHILDGFLAAANEPEEFGKLEYGYEYLLQVQLDRLAIGVRSDYKWALKVFERFQRRLIAAMRTGEASSRELMAISRAMFEAKLDPGRELVEATEKLLTEEAVEFEAGLDSAALGAEISRQCAEDPFAIYAALFSASHLGSAELRAKTVHVLLESPEAAMREAAALAVLDGDSCVRREAASALLEHCQAITPAAMRRLITMRGWVGEPVRGLIDQAVRAARRAGIECAQWRPGAALAEIHGSAPDGVGAQSVITVTKASRRYQPAGILFKRGKGIPDSWLGPPQSRQGIRRTLDATVSQVFLVALSRTYLDQTVCFYLRDGMEQDSTPAIGLLQVAEILHAPQWQPAEAGWPKILESLIAEVGKARLAPDSVRAIIAASGKWAMDARWATSWAEEGPDVTDLLKSLNGRQIDAVRNAILDAIIEKRRAVWAERFVLTAMWMKEAPPRAHLPWENFAILAQKLVEEFPLREIGAMNEIAQATAFL